VIATAKHTGFAGTGSEDAQLGRCPDDRLLQKNAQMVEGILYLPVA